MNGFSEAQTAKNFDAPEQRLLIVANKLQTGFDQPLLHTVYVDRKLGSVNAVQTLSRLNRTHSEKDGTMVLDFANEADAITSAFEPYFETTLLSEATDPNLLYDSRTRLDEFPVYDPADVDRFAKAYFSPAATQDRLYVLLHPVVERFKELPRTNARVPRPAYRLRAPLCVPGAGVALRRRRPGEAVRVRPPPPAPVIPTNCPAKCSRNSTWSRVASRRPTPAASL